MTATETGDVYMSTGGSNLRSDLAREILFHEQAIATAKQRLNELMPDQPNRQMVVFNGTQHAKGAYGPAVVASRRNGMWAPNRNLTPGSDALVTYQWDELCRAMVIHFQGPVDYWLFDIAAIVRETTPHGTFG